MEVRKLRDKATDAFAKGRFSKAAEFYEEYCRAEPKDYQARLRMGDAWAKSGQRDRAISAYQFAAEGFAREGFLPRAIAASKLILELDPAHRGVQQMLADLYARRSASGSTPAPRTAARPARRELPTFTEHMAVSMGPAVAPLELPEEDEAPEEQAPPETVVGEEIVVGVPVAAEPPSPAPAEPIRAQPASPLPVVPVPPAAPPSVPAPTPAVAAPVFVHSQISLVPQVTRPAMSAMPPGLVPKASAAPAPPPPAEPPRPAPSVQPPVSPPVQAAPAASSDETSLELDLGQGTKKLSLVAVSEPLLSITPSGPPASSSAPPGLRSRRDAEEEAPESPPTPASSAPAPSSFTELELEADSLLQAVEQAALAGMKQRAADAPASAPRPEEDEDSVFGLTEETVSDAPSVDALPNIPLFSDLPRDAFIELFERCPLRRFEQGQRVFEQGSRGNAFYVICEGTVRVFREERGERREIANLSSGAFFGEMALLSGAPRMATVESASEDTQLLEISAPVLAELSRRYPQVARALKKFCRERLLSNVMSTSALFQPFGRKDRRVLVEKFRARDVKKNELIVCEGDRTDGLYVVLSGEVAASKGDQVLARLKEGELFGEISLLQKTPATATVRATRHTSLLRLPREDFDALILTHPQILVLVSELSEQRLRRTEALTDGPVMELEKGEELLV